APEPTTTTSLVCSRTVEIPTAGRTPSVLYKRTSMKSSGESGLADSGEIRELLRGAVDLYVHTNPELLPRRIDDIALAQQMKADGFRAAMIWNQFSHTGERATVASTVTGFDMRGSIILNGTVGGLNPIVTE